MDRFERRAAEIMRLGEKRIAEKQRRNTVIRRSALSSGACAAAIAGVWLMSGDELRDAARPPHTEVVTAGTTVPAETGTVPVSGGTHERVITTTASAVTAGTSPVTGTSPVSGAAAGTGSQTAAAARSRVPDRTETAVRTAAAATDVQTTAAAERASSTAAATAQTAPPATVPAAVPATQVQTTAIPTPEPASTTTVCEYAVPTSVTTIVLAGYSFYDPEKSYHLEFVCPDEEKAELLRSLLQGLGMDPGVVTRKRSEVVYLKGSDDIVDLLGAMGAVSALMKMENVRILKEMRNSVNRQVNCETANLSKTVDASFRQVRDIEYLKEAGALDTLPEPLKEAALARLANPEIPLKELGGLLPVPVGKSGMNHRLRKLSEYAEQLRGEKKAQLS